MACQAGLLCRTMLEVGNGLAGAWPAGSKAAGALACLIPCCRGRAALVSSSPFAAPTQAFEKNPKDADTLANLVAVSLHLGKAATRYQSQLKLVSPEHAIVKRTEEGEAAFERAASAATA